MPSARAHRSAQRIAQRCSSASPWVCLCARMRYQASSRVFLGACRPLPRHLEYFLQSDLAGLGQHLLPEPGCAVVAHIISPDFLRIIRANSSGLAPAASPRGPTMVARRGLCYDRNQPETTIRLRLRPSAICCGHWRSGRWVIGPLGDRAMR